MPLSKCLKCHTESTQGFWVGTIIMIDDQEVPMKGLVKMRSDGTFDLDDLIEKTLAKNNLKEDDLLNFTGEALCPNCKSKDFY